MTHWFKHSRSPGTTPVLLMILVVSSQIFLSEGQAQTRELEMAPGTSKKIDVPDGVRKLFISNPSVIDAQPVDNGYGVVVSGQRQGNAELRITRLTLPELIYLVQVQPELQELAEEVRTLLKDVEGLEVAVVGDRILLNGRLLSSADVKRADETAKAFEGRVVSLVELDQNVDELIERALTKEIALDTVTIEVEGERLIATGTVPSRAELERVKSILKRRHKAPTVMLVIQP